MKSALDIAHYFLHQVDRASGETISALKLQKLVYYAQAWSLVFRHLPLFAEPVEAWRHGPVVRSLWKKYEAFEHYSIPAPLANLPEFDTEELRVLDSVWAVYGKKSARTLSILTHRESPWMQARQGLSRSQKSSQPIALADMQSYYQAFLHWDSATGRPQISAEAAKIKKSIEPVSNRWNSTGQLRSLVQQLQSLTPLRTSDAQHQDAEAALAALAGRSDRDLDAVQRWANRLAADVATAVD